MIKINELEQNWESGLSLERLRKKFKPAADIAIINGFPVEGNWDKIVVNDGDSIVLIERGAKPSQSELEVMMVARHTPGVYEKLKRATVGVAGLGGLGSLVVNQLARVGVGVLLIADFDIVEPSNLNRQQYFIEQIGKYKVDATTENIKHINPYVKVKGFRDKLTAENAADVFAGADAIAECFDKADQKQMLAEAVLKKMEKTVIVSASGLAGFGESNAIKTKHISARHILVGDDETAAKAGCGLMAPRVGIAASHQANAIVEFLVSES